MKVAIVHDYLNQAGGAERVVAALHRLFPRAPIYTTIAADWVVRSLLPNAEIRTSPLQRIPGITRYHRAFFLLYPGAIERLDLRGYDLVVSSSSAYAKSAIVPATARHLCYCHTPMRFGWALDDYAARETWNPLVRTALPPLMGWLRRWDQRTAHRPSRYVANSRVVADRIHRCYGRSAIVVHPPVDLSRFEPVERTDDFYLVVSRLVPYKRIDLAVDAMTRLGRRLVVIGDGPGRAALERRAGPTVTFIGRGDDRTVADYLARCRALLFPGEEDFGITPLEANASGRPVVAFGRGGALETVVPGRTGVLFGSQDPDSVVEAVRRLERTDWDSRVTRRHAEGFREEVFHRRIGVVVRSLLDGTSPEDGSGLDLDEDRSIRDGDVDRVLAGRAKDW